MGRRDINPPQSLPALSLSVELKVFKLCHFSQFSHHCLMGLVRGKKHEMNFRQSLTSWQFPAVGCWELVCYCSDSWHLFQQVTSNSIRANSSLGSFVLESVVCTLPVSLRHQLPNSTLSQNYLGGLLECSSVGPAPGVPDSVKSEMGSENYSYLSQVAMCSCRCWSWKLCSEMLLHTVGALSYF